MEKKKVSSNDLLKALNSIDIEAKEKTNPQKNLYILKTKRGNIKIWSDLEPKEFYKTLKR